MKNFRFKASIGLLIIIILAPSFLFFEVPIKARPQYSPIYLQDNVFIENSINMPEKSSPTDLIKQKLSLKFQELLKTQNLTQRVSCFVLLNEQPTERIARQVESSLIQYDRVTLHRTIYQETKKVTLPIQDALISTISSLGGKILQNYVVINALLVDIPLKALPDLAELSQIARIEPNYKLQVQLDVSQLAVTNTTAPGWDYTYNGTDVVVAVFDTGIDKDHPALVGRVINEKSFVVSEPSPNDTDGHGTHVAGIIASTNTTYMGIAPNASLVNVKIMDTSGTGDTSQLLNGLEWLLTNTSHSADVINLSAGTIAETDDGDSTLAKLVDAIVSSYNIVWVNAAGNTVSRIEVPGDAMNCISVANFNDGGLLDPSTWTIAGTSSRGPTADGRKKPDVAAPGTLIKSCEEGSIDFVEKSGTSMSAPHVAGAAALILQYLRTNNPSLGSSWHTLLTKGILLHTALDLGSPGWDNAFGHGAVDMGAVWNFLQSGDFEVGTLVPSYGICIYTLNVTSPQYVNITLLWNREASTDWEWITFNDLTNIDMRLENAQSYIEAYSTSTVDNIEQISYNASAGLYNLIIEAVDFKRNDAQGYALLSNYPITFQEFIHTWTPTEIIILVSVIGIIVVVLAYILLWLRDRKSKPPQTQPSSELSSWPEWPQQPDF
ncbi:MAG: S8 family serine peptidase [Candidatus Helarchaeota archaeon]|nr:S8 family serine peptidase [Candidatus Helarchaeota archaeon]